MRFYPSSYLNLAVFTSLYSVNFQSGHRKLLSSLKLSQAYTEIISLRQNNIFTVKIKKEVIICMKYAYIFESVFGGRHDLCNSVPMCTVLG